MALILWMLWTLVKYCVNNPRRSLLVGILFQTLSTNAVYNFRDISSIDNSTEARVSRKPYSGLGIWLRNHQENVRSLNTSRFSRSVGPHKPDSIRDVTDKLKVLQDKYNDLKAKVNEMDSSGVGASSVLKIKADLENSMADLTRRVDDIKQNIDQTHQSTMQSIVDQIQSLQSQIKAMNDEMLRKFGDVYDKLQKADEDDERRILEDVIAAIVDGHLTTALSKFKQLKPVTSPDAYKNPAVERITREAYQNSRTKFDTLNDFIRGLKYMEDCMVGYKTLLEEMKLRNKVYTPEIMQVGYRIKELIEMQNYPDLRDSSKKTIESMKASLPTCVRRILWGDVCLSNKQHTGGWLLASDFKYDSDRRYVVKTEDTRKDKWRFETIHEGRSFYMKTVNFYNEYLYAADEYFKFNAEKRRVFTWRTRETFSNFFWRVEPLDDESVRIKNGGYNEYLYASKWGLTHSFGWLSTRDPFYDGLNVLTWMTGGAELDAEWIVHQC